MQKLRVPIKVLIYLTQLILIEMKLSLPRRFRGEHLQFSNNSISQFSLTEAGMAKTTFMEGHV